MTQKLHISYAVIIVIVFRKMLLEFIHRDS